MGASDDLLNQVLLRIRKAVRGGPVEDALAAADLYWRTSRDEGDQNGVRYAVFILSGFRMLARRNVAALAVMEGWLDDALAALAGDARGDKMRAAEVACLTEALDRPEVLFAVTDQQRGTPAMKQLAKDNTTMFVAAQRYSLLVDAGVCEPQYVKARREMILRNFTSPEPRDSETAEIERENEVDEVAVPFEALAGVGRDADALELAALVLGQPDDSELRVRLASAAARAGNRVLAGQIRDGA